MTDNAKSITVSDLTDQIKDILEGEFGNIWVSGEISNFKHHYSDHMYFDPCKNFLELILIYV